MLNRRTSALLLFLLLIAPSILHTQPALIKAKVEECNAALLEGNFEKLVEMTYPPLVELMGGGEAMIELVRGGIDMMKSSGFTIESAEVQEPARIVTTRRRTYAVVPYHLIMNSPVGKFRQESTMLGISTDKGKSWTFVDVHEDPEMLLSLLFSDEKKLNKRLLLKRRPGPVEISEE